MEYNFYLNSIFNYNIYIQSLNQVSWYTELSTNRIGLSFRQFQIRCVFSFKTVNPVFFLLRTSSSKLEDHNFIAFNIFTIVSPSQTLLGFCFNYSIPL